ncbi:MAG TPA: TIGR02186 family protein [Rhizomicrobium sp.]|nr:TIGR02186 family protein [Rhizomicrobium sp.]
MMRALAVALALLAGCSAAFAQDLVSGLSQDQVEINSSYAGTSIVVFGAIEGEDPTPSSPKDVVVVIRGPDADMIVRRKTRIAGVWINRDQMKFGGMPAYYYLASSRPLDKIASPQTLARYQLGLAYVTPQRILGTHRPEKAEPFRVAAVAERARDGLYAQTETVEFLSYSLFRVHIPIPATVPRGEYTVEAYLFRDGTVTSAQSTPLYVDQKGLERRLYRFAHASPFVYGLSAVLMAVLLGWLSSLLIRQPR